MHRHALVILFDVYRGQRNYHGGNGRGPAKVAGEQTDYGNRTHTYHTLTYITHTHTQTCIQHTSCTDTDTRKYTCLYVRTHAITPILRIHTQTDTIAIKCSQLL